MIKNIRDNKNKDLWSEANEKKSAI